MSIDEPESANDQQPPDDEQREGADLERYGRFRVPRRAPFDIGAGEVLRGRKPGSARFRRTPARDRPFQRVEEGGLVATGAATRGRTRGERVWLGFKRLVLGAPLATSRLAEERLSKMKALAVFSSDMLSSSAYATEEILLVLLFATTAAFNWSIPIAFAIAGLVVVVALSYSQVIRGYPNGGGSYAVAKENLGRVPSLVAGASLVVDYVLTVAVSTAAGVAAIVSAFPELGDYRIEMAVGAVAVLTLANLRGIRESGSLFAIPAYFFVVTITALIITGMIRLALGHDLTVDTPGHALAQGTQGVTLFLILRAFSSGASALTGIEAISNGVPSFKPPEARNANITLAWMAVILTFFFIGVTVLAYQTEARPSEEITVVAQVGEGVFGSGVLFYLVQTATTLILLLAANTSFAGLPSLGSVMARDRFLPRQFAFRGDRLAFSHGIIFLGLASVAMLIIFQADTHRLIPLYAVGVFIGFTLSQTGMIIHWRGDASTSARASLLINAVGAVATGVVAVIIAYAKFEDGAWLTLAAIAALTFFFARIGSHYRRVEEQLEVTELPPSAPPTTDRYRERAVVVPVDELNQAVLHTVEYARTISDHVTAVHVTDEMEAGKRLREAWERALPDTPLEIIVSPQRSFIVPMLRYVDAVDRVDPAAYITVVIPEYVPAHFWEGLLHNQSAVRLKKELMRRPHTVVIDVPYHLEP